MPKILDIKDWSKKDMEDLYSNLGSFDKCASATGCERHTWGKYWDQKGCTSEKYHNRQKVYKASQMIPYGSALDTSLFDPISPVNSTSNYNTREEILYNIGDKLYNMGDKRYTKTASSDVFLDPSKCDVALLDIEATSLKGDYGVILCCVLQKYGTKDPQTVISIDPSHNDMLECEKHLIGCINDELSQYDGIISYYGTKYDIPMIRTRAIYHGLQPIQKMKHLDMYYTMKRNVNTGSRRMDRINELMRVSNCEFPSKTPVSMSQWMNVMFSHDQKSLDYVIEHCSRDVTILSNIVDKFIDLVPDRIVRM